jgi:hypothetical protein
MNARARKILDYFDERFSSPIVKFAKKKTVPEHPSRSGTTSGISLFLTGIQIDRMMLLLYIRPRSTRRTRASSSS